MAARSLVMIGAATGFFALPVLMWNLTASTSWTATLAAAQGLPVLLVSPVASFLVDNFPRFRVAVASDTFSCLVILTLLATAAAQHLTPIALLIIAVTLQAVAAVAAANNHALVMQVAGQDRVGLLQARLHQVYSLADVAVPMLAGAALAVAGMTTLFGLWAGLLAGSALIMFRLARAGHRLQPDPAPRRKATELLRTYLQFTRASPPVARQVIVATSLMVGGGIIVGQMVPWMEQRLGLNQSDWHYGIIFTAWGLGSLLGATAAARLPEGRRWKKVFTIASLTFTSSVLVAATTTNAWVATFAIATWATTNMLLAIGTLADRQRATPAELQGSVAAYSRAISLGIGWPVGAAAAGVGLAIGIDLPAILTGYAASAVLVLSVLLLRWNPTQVQDMRNGTHS